MVSNRVVTRKPGLDPSQVVVPLHWTPEQEYVEYHPMSASVRHVSVIPTTRGIQSVHGIDDEEATLSRPPKEHRRRTQRLHSRKPSPNRHPRRTIPRRPRIQPRHHPAHQHQHAHERREHRPVRPLHQTDPPPFRRVAFLGRPNFAREARAPEVDVVEERWALEEVHEDFAGHRGRFDGAGVVVVALGFYFGLGGDGVDFGRALTYVDVGWFVYAELMVLDGLL